MTRPSINYTNMLFTQSGKFFARKVLGTLLIVMLLFAHACRNSESPKESEAALPYLNTTLTMETRVNDLVGRMTLEEKISQMVNQAAAIERLGIPEYNWWSEGLHGVARAGLATVFPQAIGMGATWDRDMMFRM
jgi:beta-glucosidase